MRHILIAASALAVAGIFTSAPASAQQAGAPTYFAGGPMQIGSWCKVATDQIRGDDSYGFYQPCGGQALASAPRRKR